MAKGRVPANKSMIEVSASVAKLKAEFQDIIKLVEKLSKEGKSAKEIYDAQAEGIEKQLKLLEQESEQLKKIKKSLKERIESDKLDSKQRADMTKALNKAVSLEKQLGTVKKNVQKAMIAAFQEEQAQYRNMVDLGEKELSQIKEKLDAVNRASEIKSIENRIKEEGLAITEKEKNQQQQLRDQIKEGNARRTEEVKAFEGRRAEFARKRKARLKELGQLEKKQEQDRIAAAKTQLEIDLKMLNRGKMTLEQRREAQAKLIRGFRANYDQQSNDYKKLTLRLIKLDESFEKQIADRDRARDKGSKDYARREEQRQKALNTARRKVFKAEIDLANTTAKKKIDAVNKYYNSELRNLRVLGKENSAEYKNIYSEQLRLLKKYYKEKEAEDKKAASKAEAGAATQPQRTGFLDGLRQGFRGGDIGKAVGRLTGIGSVVAVLRKSFQALSRAITGSFQAAVDFEAQLAQLQAVTGISNEELSKLEKSVLNVAGSTKFTSEEIVQLQTELGKLGFSVDEIEAATLAVARTAQALGEQVGPVAQRIGQILNQFNLSASETARVADSLVSVINSSALSFEGFSTALQYIGPLGAEVGTTFEETSVAMALLADNGFTASRVGTGLRGILTELSTTGKDLFTVVEELADKEITLAEAVDLVGKRNAAQLITLVEAAKQQDQVGQSLDDLSNKYFNQGSAAIAAAQQIDTFQGNLDLLKSAVNRVQISFGNFLKTSKLLRLALKVIDEEGYNAALAAEAIAATDPTKFSQDLTEAADVVGKMRQEMDSISDIRIVTEFAAKKIVEETIINPEQERLRLLREQKKELDETLKRRREEAEAVLERARNDEEYLKSTGKSLLELSNDAVTAGNEEASNTEEKRKLTEQIDSLEKKIKKRREEGFEAEIEYVKTLITETSLQTALELERNAVIEERKEILEDLQGRRDDEIKTLKDANDFNVEVNAEAEVIQGKINEMLAEQAKRKEEGNAITGEELLLFNARLKQYEQEKSSLAGLVFQKGELQQLAQKEFEKEFKELANRIQARRQQLTQEQAILDVQIKTQQNLAKNAKTEAEREAASQRLAELQIERSQKEQEAYEDLNALAEEYRKIIKGVGDEIVRAELDASFIDKAKQRLKSFELGFADLEISVTDLADSVGILAISLGKVFENKLSKGIELDKDDLAVVDQQLKTLITGMGIAENTEEFDKLFEDLKPLLMSYLIPDPESEVVEKRKKLLTKIIGKISDAIKEYNATALRNTQERLNREIEAIKERYKTEGEILKSQLDNQLITENQFRLKQKELRLAQVAEENMVEKKRFEAQKKADLINVAVETAEALASNIINNFKSFNTLKATGLTAAGNFVILGGGAAKADAIRRRKFFPAKYEEGGMVEGPSHAEGGVPFTVQGRGGYEMEGGEFIVNKKAASLHRNLLERINGSYNTRIVSERGTFAQGGMITNQSLSPNLNLINNQIPQKVVLENSSSKPMKVIVEKESSESVDYLKAIAEATTSTAIGVSKPVRAYVSQKDLRNNATERTIRDRNDRI